MIILFSEVRQQRWHYFSRSNRKSLQSK